MASWKKVRFGITGFPLGLKKLENLEIGKALSSQGLLNRKIREKSGKIIQNTEKFREFQKNISLFVIFSNI